MESPLKGRAIALSTVMQDDMLVKLLNLALREDDFVFLAVSNNETDSAPLRSKFAELASAYSSFAFVHYTHEDPFAKDAVSGAGKKIASILGVECSNWGTMDALILCKSGKKYLLATNEEEGSPCTLTAGAMEKFLNDVMIGSVQEFVKSQPRAPKDMEPFLPGLHRITTSNWSEVVMAQGTDVFIDDGADWCPYCVLMNPYIYDLAWVMKAVPNVIVGQIDCNLNDTSSPDIQRLLHSEGIPNLVLLTAEGKLHGRPNPESFGDRNEGSDPNLKLEALVSFIHMNMEEKKFNEERFLRRARLIRGKEGFLSSLTPCRKGTWYDVLTGAKQEQQASSFAALRSGVPAMGKDGKLALEPWGKAIRQAVLFDRRQAVVEHASQKGELAESDELSFDLVLTKLQHQIKKERLSAEVGDRLVVEAIDLKEKIPDLGKLFAPPDAVREVFYSFSDMKILGINTLSSEFDAEFTLTLKWHVKESDVSHSADETTVAWKPPPVKFRNAKKFPSNVDAHGQDEVLYFRNEDRGGGWYAKQQIEFSGTFIEELELRSYPFDAQDLKVFVGFEASREEQWALTADTAVMQRNVFSALAEWSVEAPQCESFYEHHGKMNPTIDTATLGGVGCDDKPLISDDVRPVVVLRLVAVRKWVQFMWTVGYIQAALGILGNWAFLLDPQEELGDRMAIFLTNWLAACAFQTVVDSSLPKGLGISLVQVYMLLMNSLIILGVIEVGLSKLWEVEDDSFYLFINPPLWLAIHLIASWFAVDTARKQRDRVQRPIDHEELFPHEAPKFSSCHLHSQVRSEQCKDADRLGGLSSIIRNFFRPSTDVEPGPGTVRVSGELQCEAKPPRVQLHAISSCPKSEKMQRQYGPSGIAWWLGDDAERQAARDAEDVDKIWHGVFAKVDQDGNGFVDAAEMEKIGEQYKPIKDLLEKSDNNKDGVISAEEWGAMLSRMRSEMGDPSPDALALLRLCCDDGLC